MSDALDPGFDTGVDVPAPLAESTVLDAPGRAALPMAEQLHRSMGFRAAETWAVFS